MAPPNYTYGNAYADDRRHSGSRPEPYRPGDRDRPPYRRDSRDFRDGRHSTDPRGARSPHDTRIPREYRRENESQRPSPIDTSVKALESSKNKASNSPASAASKPGEVLHLKQMDATSQKSIATSIAIVNPLSPVIPKAQNPDLQEVFENGYRLRGKSHECLLLSIQKNKMTQKRTQQRLENEKFGTKAAAYPPYNGLAHKYDLVDQELDDKITVAENSYARALEQFIAHFMTAKPTITNNRDSTVDDLEAKIEKLSQLVAKQGEQIQSLLEDNKESRNSVTTLEADYQSIKSSHNDLKVKYIALESKHDALESESCSSRNTIQTLQSQQSNTDTENKNLRKQLTDIGSNADKKLGSFQAQLTQLAESGKAFEYGLGKRITGVEAKVEELDEMKEKFDEVKDKLDELDLTTFNEVCDAWVNTEYNLKTQHEEYRRRRQNGSSTDDALQSIRQELDSLRATHSQPGTGAGLSIQAVEAMVNSKVAAAEQSINHETQTYCEGRDNILGDMIDGVSSRITVLEKEASKRSGLETRVQLLEQWKATDSTAIGQNQDLNLAERVGRLEGQKIGHRVDRIDLAVGQLGQKYEALTGESSPIAKREWVEGRLQEVFNAVTSGLSNDTKDLQRKIAAVELAIKALDAQYQNLSTKQLAEHIVRLTNPVFEQRLGKVETKANQLEGKANGNDKTVSQHTEQLNSITALLRSLVPGEKRVASPSHLDEPSKKRKLEVNGRHPSPLQQQQRNS
ncbi:hypothetical protein O1611_g1145 [Lasiodiplodia mahajangana]|uniref:Uncharacterized protein n=1 Tax=Lasiodiplodia mahajangana TaxID=1108764 RepID=A0ACC2JYH5_9PEZI|nr:hypothetical protein O1611_g1145 [Lasiodiplodia mahajangana]